MPLRPHQVEPAEQLLTLLQKHDSVVDWSDGGVGKTYVGAWVASQLKLPALIVGPKISKTAWDLAAETFNDKFSFCNYELLRTGNQKFGTWTEYRAAREYFQCENCQCKVDFARFVPCYCHPAGIHCLVTKKISAHYGSFVFNPAVRLVIFDESQRFNGIDSLNCELGLAAKRQGIKTLCLSATPASSPLDMRALGYLLDLHNDSTDELVQTKFGAAMRRPSFKRWLAKQEVRFDVHTRGLKWFASKSRQLEIMKSIRDQIIPARGVRVTVASIPGFPTCQIDAELYDLDKPEEMDRAYGIMREAVETLKQHASENDKSPDHPLTKILRAQQTVELLKVPVMTELGETYADRGLSVVFFVNYRQTIEELLKKFPGAGIIDGTTIKTREKTLAAFQSNHLRKLIVNSKAGGVSMSLHDLHGGHPRAGIASPCFSAETMRQLFFRLPRESGKSHSFYKVLFAAGTIEKKIWSAVRGKLNNLDALMTLTDSDWCPDNLPLNR